MSYLHQHNPEINWQAGEWKYSRCPTDCGYAEPEENLTEVASQSNTGSPEDQVINEVESWEKLVPDYLHSFGDVFSKKASERMPTRKPYDHAIEFEE
ncbi:uncharacterized protein LAESUDRAFT_667158, partial [Laetiporus sulphureus 93-53]